MNNGRVNKRSRQERALVHVQNRIAFWDSFPEPEVVVDGKPADPQAKLETARAEEASLLKVLGR